MIRRSRADVLLSTGNFAIRRSPVPQILLSRNSIYLSPDFYRDLLKRREYRTWVEARLRGILARKSIHWANLTVAPSEAFAADLTRWSKRRVLSIHHGFDYEEFTRDVSPLPADVNEKLLSAGECWKILFVSHYNYYRNFETLIRALPLLRDRITDRPVKLLLTCNLAAGKNPGAYRVENAARLVRELDVSEMIVELGAIPYHQLHHVYRRADIYVSPAYTETFAHPLVEAMASGVPVVASDIPVHREICGAAGMYFPRFAPDVLAQMVTEVLASPELAASMVDRGSERSRQFSWTNHVEQILELCQALAASGPITAPLRIRARRA
ncbi:MAG TPA: glycosyltransferase [Candidatus Acidoferrales bacterium]|nr:glycosyltransferase [Candidatus Acidoferrales bacterium]